MPFTLRLLLLLTPVPALIALSAVWGDATMLALIYVAALGALFVKDYSALPQDSDVEVKRIAGNVLSLSAQNPVSIVVRYRGKNEVVAEFRDGLPAEFETSVDTHACRLLPGTTMEFQHQLRPLKRGEFALGPMYVRYTAPYGLAERKAKLPNEQLVRVIPDIVAAKKYDLRLKRGLLKRAGNRIMRIVGRGSEFESLRQYGPDDDPRHIDWRATARHGKVLVRSYQPETRQRIIICIDLGRMMLGKFRDVAKVDSVLNACIMLTHAAIKMGDSVGFIAFSDELDARTAARSGKGQVNLVLHQAAALDPKPVETDFRILLRELGGVERRRALVVLFTDFIDETQIDEMVQVLTSVKRKHRVLVAAVRDVETFELAIRAPNTERELFGAAAAAHLLVQRASAIKRLEAAGILVADLDQTELSMGVVERYMELRETAVF